VWRWTVSEADAAAVDAAVARLEAHCREEHPLIRELLTLHRDADGTREYTWLERFDSEDDLAADHYDDRCAALWEPVRSAAGDTFAGGATAAGPGYQL
jgi:hypothetical protein